MTLRLGEGLELAREDRRALHHPAARQERFALLAASVAVERERALMPRTSEIGKHKTRRNTALHG
jgi:hypothetical protein